MRIGILFVAGLLLAQGCKAPAPRADHPVGPSSLLAYWQGNSALGQTADSSGHHRDLVVVNSVLNPLTPTPGEGDRWLGADFFSTQGCFKIPLEAIPPEAEGKFSVIFYHNTLPCCGAGPHQTILSMRSADGAHFFDVGYADAGIRGFYVDYSGKGVGYVPLGEVASPNLKPSPGTRLVLEIQWSAAGVAIVENGVVINSNKTPFDKGKLTEAWLGNQDGKQPNSSQNYLDGAAFSSDIHAAYPPPMAHP